MYKKAWEKTIQLHHDEDVAIINKRTGEIKQAPSGRTSNNGMVKFKLMKTYTRFQSTAWDLLRTQVSTPEFNVAMKLALKAKAFTNSLEPLKPELTVTLIANELGENRKTIMSKINKLFKLGVIGKFEVGEGETLKDSVISKYWIFNPYLAFNGNVINKDTVTLFDGTFYAKMSR